MVCFSLGAIESLIIWLIVLCAVVAVIKLFLPGLLAAISPAGSTLAAVIDIILWAVVAIIVVIIAFDLLSCLFGWGRLHG